MKDSTYHFLVSVLDLFLWSGKLLGEENLPARGPAVFLANHLDAAGPIAVTCSIPLRVYPWVVADMMDRRLAPDWMRQDFVERQLRLKPPFSRWLAKALCRITVPLFHALGCIPVYRDDYTRLQETLRRSVDLLREEKFLFIFPEDNRLPTDPATRMQPFQHTFVRLGEMYYAERRERLPFIPVAVHGAGYLQVGKAVLYNPLNPPGVERRRVKDLVEKEVIRMYLELDGQTTEGERRVATAERK